MADKNRHGLSRHIPREVEDKVRSECGFGCAVCGEIFVELHHFAPQFKDAHQHDPAQVIALCEKHHKYAGNGEMSDEDLASHRASPYAKRQGFVSQDLIWNSKTAQVVIGSDYYAAASFKFCVDTIPILWFFQRNPSGPLEINAIFRDSDFRPILRIERNMIRKNLSDIAIRKIGGRYIIGDELKPLLSFEVVGGNTLHIHALHSRAINSDVSIDRGGITVVDGPSTFVGSNNTLIGFCAMFGRIPGPIPLKAPSGDLVPLVNGHGDTIGFRSQGEIFNSQMQLRAVVDAHGNVQRVFRRHDGQILEEHIIGRLKNHMIFAAESDSVEGPLFPFPLPLIEEVLFYSQNQFRTQHCITGVICSEDMPGRMNLNEPFFAL